MTRLKEPKQIFRLMDGGFIAGRPGKRYCLLCRVDSLREPPGFGIRSSQGVEQLRVPAARHRTGMFGQSHGFRPIAHGCIGIGGQQPCQSLSTSGEPGASRTAS